MNYFDLVQQLDEYLWEEKGTETLVDSQLLEVSHVIVRLTLGRRPNDWESTFQIDLRFTTENTGLTNKIFGTDTNKFDS